MPDVSAFGMQTDLKTLREVSPVAVCVVWVLCFRLVSFLVSEVFANFIDFVYFIFQLPAITVALNV